ncbi:MAG TPA: integration host factor, actinobacterial type [Thermoleophilia bacterium]|nr:integration host factor, actinobacterial type [Thermoleophilia bacterium]
MSTPTKQLNVAPARSLDQRREALRRANLVRSRRAALKVDLKKGKVTIASVLREPPEYLLTAKVLDVLMAAPKCGRVKSARIMEQCRVSPSKTVGGLSDRQRSELLGYFGG